MRYLTGLILYCICLSYAYALTPPLDGTPALFSGEWAGNSAQGSYCYINLNEDGSGWVLIDGGAGDWLGARLKWRNLKQTLQVEKITPLISSPQQRISPLDKISIRTEFNQTLSLTWSPKYPDCQLQRIEITAHHLNRARSVIGKLRQDERK